MDNFVKLWDELLKTVHTLTTWPLIVLYLFLLFRKALTKQIPALFQSLESLVERLVTAKFKGIELDFRGLQKFAASAGPQLTQAVTANLDETRDADNNQAVDDKEAVDELAAPKRFLPLAVGAAGGSLSEDQAKIVTALAGSDYDWRTRDRLLAVTGIAPAQLDAALTQLLEQSVIMPAFSKNHNIVFGLRERVTK